MVIPSTLRVTMLGEKVSGSVVGLADILCSLLCIWFLLLSRDRVED